MADIKLVLRSVPTGTGYEIQIWASSLVGTSPVDGFSLFLQYDPSLSTYATVAKGTTNTLLQAFVDTSTSDVVQVVYSSTGDSLNVTSTEILVTTVSFNNANSATDFVGSLTNSTVVQKLDSNSGEPVDYVLDTLPTIDTVEAEVSQIALTAETGAVSGFLNAGDTVTATVTFKKAVTVTGTPHLTLDIGGVNHDATYSSGSGSTSLLFTYTVQSGDTDANGISIGANALALNGGTIKDSSSNDAVVTSLLVGDNPSYKVDTTAPTAPTLALATDAGSSNSDGVTNVGTVNVSGIEANATWEHSTNGGTGWTAGTGTSFTLGAGTYPANDIEVKQTDVAGNVSSEGKITSQVVVDTIAPTVSGVTDTTTANVTKDAVIFTVTFTEAVIGNVTTNSFTAINGTVTNVTHGSGNTYTVTVTPTANVASGNVALSLVGTGLTDTAGNAIISADLSSLDAQGIDTLAPAAPTAIAEQASTDLSDSLLNSAEAATTTFRVALPSSGLVGGDSIELLLGGTSFSTPKTATITTTEIGQGYVDFTVAKADLGSDGSKALTAKITDAAGNVGTASTALNFTLDTTAPAFSRGTVQGTTLTLYYNEALDDTNIPAKTDFTVSNNTVTNVAVNSTAKTVTLTLGTTVAPGSTIQVTYTDPTGDDANAIQDAAGNDVATLGPVNVSTNPTVTISAIGDGNVSMGENATVTFTFSEAPTNFTVDDITAPHLTLSNFAVSPTDAKVYTVDVTPDQAGVTATGNVLTVSDDWQAGGLDPLGTTNSGTYDIDTVAPTVTIVVADTALKTGETSLVTITFSEAVTVFDNNDLSIASGILSTVASTDGGTTWTGTLTPTADIEDTTNVITINKTGVTDVAGNAGVGITDSNNYVIDTKAPTATIVVADTALKAGETTLVTITFSEAVTGFDNNDLTVANGTLSNVSSTDGGLTWTATLTPTTSIEDTTNVITLANTGVTDAAGNAGVSTTDSNNYLIDTQAPAAPGLVAEPGSTDLTDNLLNSAEAATTTFRVTLPTSGSMAAVGDSVELLLGGVSFSTANKVMLDATVVNTNGYVDFTVVKADLGADGAKALTAKITDAAGNVSTASTALSFELDTIAPANSAYDVIATTTEVTAKLIDELGTTNDTVWAKIDAGAFTDITLTSVTGTEITWTTAVPDSTTTPVTITIEVRDQAGNATSSMVVQQGSTSKQTTTIMGTTAPQALVVEANTNAALLTAVVPEGVGLLFETIQDNNDADLNDAFDTAFEELNENLFDVTVVQDALNEFLEDVTNVVIRNISFTGATSILGAFAEDELIIKGDGTGDEALVIDAANLPDDAILTLDDVDFAVIESDTAKTLFIRGGDGDNIVYAGAGSQGIFLSSGDDKLSGGLGNDTVASDGGNDSLYGGAGDDSVVGGIGDDYLYGEADNDTLEGGTGNDTVHFSGNLADYYGGITFDGTKFTIKDMNLLNGDAGTDTVIDVEFFEFADHTKTEADMIALANNPYVGSHDGLGTEASLAGVLAFSLIAWMVL